MTTNPMRGVIPVVLAGAAVFLALNFWNNEPPPGRDLDSAELARVADRILAVPGIDGLLARCPAEIQGSWTSRSWLAREDKAVGEGTCARNFGRCASACLEGNSGEACTMVAYILESRDSTLKPAARHGYALGCALGDPSGCTNRGANIRNAARDDDPLSLLPRSQTASCLFNTFEAACAAGDAWGCAMSGQTYAQGEGVERDRQTAARLYRQACTLSGEGPDAESVKAPCRFARSRLESLEAAD
jgi:hypothetical protein